MAIYGYARCSTNENMQDITRQIRELKELGVKDTSKIYKEYESGTKTDRPELCKLLEIIQESDTLICTEVSRISRSTRQLCEIIELAKEKHLKLIFGTFVLDCTKQLDIMSEGMLKMMGVFSELERSMISELVKSGMKNAQAKGKKIGRPATDADAIPSIFCKHYPKYIKGEINKKEFSRLCDLSYPTIYKYLKLIETTKRED